LMFGNRKDEEGNSTSICQSYRVHVFGRTARPPADNPKHIQIGPQLEMPVPNDLMDLEPIHTSLPRKYRATSPASTRSQMDPPTKSDRKARAPTTHRVPRESFRISRIQKVETQKRQHSRSAFRASNFRQPAVSVSASMGPGPTWRPHCWQKLKGLRPADCQMSDGITKANQPTRVG